MMIVGPSNPSKGSNLPNSFSFFWDLQCTFQCQGCSGVLCSSRNFSSPCKRSEQNKQSINLYFHRGASHKISLNIPCVMRSGLRTNSSETMKPPDTKSSLYVWFLTSSRLSTPAKLTEGNFFKDTRAGICRVTFVNHTGFVECKSNQHLLKCKINPVHSRSRDQMA